MKLLIRGVGPGLEDQGVVDYLADPKITVFSAKGEALLTNGSWDVEEQMEEIETLSAELGAFALEAGSGDAALSAILAPGVYTVILSSEDGNPGVGLLEIYAVP